MDPDTPYRPERRARKRDQVATEEQPQPARLASTPPIRVLVAGAEGFLGSHLLPRLLSRRHRVRATFRDPDGPGRRTAPGADWRPIDLTRAEQVRGLCADCDVVVHLAGLFKRAGALTLAKVHGTGTRNLIAEAERCGVRRLVYVSVLGARPGNADYFGTKFDAETAIVSSSIPSVILRPSVIYGPGDQFTTTIVRLLRTLPAFPMLGTGSFRLQPLAVEDMVDALSQCVERSDLDGCEFDVAGPDRMTFREIVAAAASVLELQRPIVPLPGGIAITGAQLAHRMRLPAPFTPEQLALFASGGVLSSEDNPLIDVFRLKLLPFRDALEDYLEPEA